MYQNYWGFERPLFTPDAGRGALDASPVHTEALARLDFLTGSQCPLGLLLGASGSGKSTVLAEFAKRAERSGAVAAFVSAAGADEAAILAELATGLSLPVEPAAWQTWRLIADRLCELKLDTLRAVVLLDDVDRAAAGALAVVERLLALDGAPLTIVASARPETAARLGARLLGQASLRIDLNPWNEAETNDYLTAQLKQAGSRQPAFDAGAARRLFELSGGAPRRVNQLAQLALVAGASQRLVQIDEQTIAAVHEELSASR
jgi:type II secretory pathway predicted ATPase ExeA